ncbi:MAG: hypothetical protein PWQ82_1838 [Thermosediminibacterales bacterium]|nr:hypothetical protein [Thermosediminibacterales bacterium]
MHLDTKFFKVGRAKKYAELHGNMQKYRIKSLYGNIMDTIKGEHFKQLTEVSENMKKIFERFQPLTEQTEKLSKMFKVGGYRPPLRQLRGSNRVNSWEALT